MANTAVFPDIAFLERFLRLIYSIKIQFRSTEKRNCYVTSYIKVGVHFTEHMREGSGKRTLNEKKLQLIKTVISDY